MAEPKGAEPSREQWEPEDARGAPHQPDSPLTAASVPVPSQPDGEQNDLGGGKERFGRRPPQVFRCADGVVGLRGDFEASSAHRSLFALLGPKPDGQILLDLSGVRFLHHRVLVTLDDHGRRHQFDVVLRAAPDIVTRLVRLMPLERLRLVEDSER